MAEDPQVLAESLRTEVVQIAAVHEEAQAKARAADMHSVVTAALKEVLTQGDEGTKRLLIQKIPLLCTDVMTMKNDLRDIKNDGKWTKWIMSGFATFSVLVGLPLLAWILVTIVKNASAIAVLNHAALISH
jgi:hypothetical protein